MRTCIRISVTFLLFALTSTAFGAQTTTNVALPQRLFVASNGNDANPCTRSAPCRNLQAAIDGVATNGEVIVLDSAGYGPAVIAHAVSIIAPPGVYAGITALSGYGIEINTGGQVTLRGLTLNGLGGISGVQATDAPYLHIDQCMFSNFTAPGGSGLAYPEASRGTSRLYIHNSYFKHNYSGIITSVSTDDAPGAVATMLVDHCRFEVHSNAGIEFGPNLISTVKDTISSQAMVSFMADGNIDTLTTFINCEAIDSGYGFVNQAHNPAGPAGVMRVRDSTAADNGYGFVSNEGTFESMNNMVRGNGTNKSGTGTIASITPD